MRDYYSILGVNNDASAEDITRAYRKLCLKLHPDRNPGDAEAEERFKRVQHAYEVLSNETKRNHYDATGDDLGDVDPELLRHFQHLGQCCAQAIGECMKQRLDAARQNLVGMIRNILHAQIQGIKKQIIDFERVEMQLGRLTDRFAVKDGPNLLDDFIRGELHQMADNIKNGAREIDFRNKCLEVLEGVTYRMDRDGNFDFTKGRPSIQAMYDNWLMITGRKE